MKTAVGARQPGQPLRRLGADGLDAAGARLGHVDLESGESCRIAFDREDLQPGPEPRKLKGHGAAAGTHVPKNVSGPQFQVA